MVHPWNKELNKTSYCYLAKDKRRRAGGAGEVDPEAKGEAILQVNGFLIEDQAKIFELRVIFDAAFIVPHRRQWRGFWVWGSDSERRLLLVTWQALTVCSRLPDLKRVACEDLDHSLIDWDRFSSSWLSEMNTLPRKRQVVTHWIPLCFFFFLILLIIFYFFFIIDWWEVPLLKKNQRYT